MLTVATGMILLKSQSRALHHHADNSIHRRSATSGRVLGVVEPDAVEVGGVGQG